MFAIPSRERSINSVLQIAAAILAVVFGCAVADVHAIEPANQKQNLLIITIDDMNCDSVGVYGCKLPKTTPSMDALAATALRFDFAHVQVGNCMPSRNVMWSGRYPHNNRVEGFYQVKDPHYPVLCDLAKDAGYFTAIRHKIGHSTPHSPYGWDLELDKLDDGKQAHVKDAQSYGDSTRRAIAAARAANKPFCVMINVADPHKPFFSEVKQGADPHVPSRTFGPDEIPVPGFLPDDPIVRAELSRYYSSVRRADDGVAAIMTALAESGTEEDTIVVFLSDHGMPLPFAKTQLYHHSTRTPLMIRWPGVTRAGTVDSEHMVSAVDLLPTLVEMLGWSPVDDWDGRSFASVLKGDRQTDRDWVIKEYNENSGAKRNPMRAVETKEYLYIFNAWSNGDRPMATATNGTDTFKRMKVLAQSDSQIAERVEWMVHRGVEELYHVRSDPDCMKNLIGTGEHREAADRLRSILADHLAETDDPLAETFLRRSDSQALEAYMATVQQAADARRAAKRKMQPSKKRLRLITWSKAKINRDGHLVASLRFDLPKELSTQAAFVTLKDKEGKRIERKQIELSGKGMSEVTFVVPEGHAIEQLAIAAFVGPDYANNLHHIQSPLAKILKK